MDLRRYREFGLTFTHKKKCTITHAGTFRDVCNWKDGVGTPNAMRTVEEFVFHQKDFMTCWAVTASESSYCARHRAGQDTTPRLSTQQLIDELPVDDDTMTGMVASALQHVKIHGIKGNKVYGRYTGQKGVRRKRARPNEAVYRIDDWVQIRNDDDSIKDALSNHVLVVQVEPFDAFLKLKGKNLLDFSEAERMHEYAVYKDGVRRPIIKHAMLMIGHGVFTPAEPYNDLQLEYFIMKNSHGKNYGHGGLAYVLTNSTLRNIHGSPLIRKCSNRFYEVNYFPLCPYVTIQDVPIPNCPSRVKTDYTIEDLFRLTYGLKDIDKSLIFLFYDPMYCQGNGVNVPEIFGALGKAYAYDTDSILAMIDTSSHTDADLRRFKLRDGGRLDLRAYMPSETARGQEHIILYDGEFTLGKIMLWVSSSVGACKIHGTRNCCRG